ncbi:MAG TPA: sodium-translocating pyrophosphatase [Candidatus Aenigmarchaeota archaeon]|nr:sodium-translocating pyrophosphatase [Candidatus Aenigmarchaeota archaeon]
MLSLNEYFPLVASILALLFALIFALIIKRSPGGNKSMKEIGGYIHTGAMVYLNKQYKVLLVFVIIVSLLLCLLLNPLTSVAFIFGAVLSALAGNIGMRIATTANSKAAEGCRKSINAGLRIAFLSGSVMGLCVVGLGLLGISLFFILSIVTGGNILKLPQILFGFGFGASSIALFARVGGGIYTKAADVGADLVGKVEAGIPEDDPRNPAVIADNVGDNVGDVAGMGADLFESYVDSIIAAMAIGVMYSSLNRMLLPMFIAAIGIVMSIIGTFFVRAKRESDASKALNKGVFMASILMFIASYFIITATSNINVWFATIAGLIAGMVIGLTTEYFTSDKYRPTKSIANAAKTGAATNVIAGISVGMLSTAVPVIVVASAIVVAYYFAGLYGIAMAAIGMLSTLGITLATDTYGPVADNAAGIAEMAGLGKDVRERAEALDAVGNTTAAIGKGFAIGSAALTALALFSVYGSTTGITTMSITDPYVISGIFIGALLPFLFSSFALGAVGRAAEKMVKEVRRQFKEIKGLMEGKAKPDYEKCIEISTHAALREMIIPGLIALIAPLLTGIVLGLHALGGLLAGATATGFLLALFMANTGGAWDNAKKYIEKGNLGGKGSSTHKAAVIGDTVGDPFKDTAGPSLNILIKLMSIVALIFASAMI